MQEGGQANLLGCGLKDVLDQGLADAQDLRELSLNLRKRMQHQAALKVCSAALQSQPPRRAPLHAPLRIDRSMADCRGAQGGKERDQRLHVCTHPCSIEEVVGAGCNDDLCLLLQAEVLPAEVRVDV